MVMLAVIVVIVAGALSYWYIKRIDPTDSSYRTTIIKNIQGISLGGFLIFVVGLVSAQPEAGIYGLAVAGTFGLVYSRFMER